MGHCGQNGFYIKDNGPGLDPDQVAELFSISRPLRSSKFLRLPSRGALGNGLRVVSGAVLATHGKLIVSTRGRSIRLAPQHDGLTNAEIVGSYDGNGMRVEVHLGLDVGKVDLSWAHVARRLAKGDYYKGKTSAYWYTAKRLS